jgi:hypothetical protein
VIYGFTLKTDYLLLGAGFRQRNGNESQLQLEEEDVLAVGYEVTTVWGNIVLENRVYV